VFDGAWGIHPPYETNPPGSERGMNAI
jgi:hypothetical protein